MRRTRAHTRTGPVAGAVVSALLLTVVACQDESPTAVDDSFLPEEPLTVEVELPWSAFGSDLQVVGGYSTAASIPAPLVARAYEGTLEARTLMRFDTLPLSIRVETDGGVVTDTEMTYIGGFVTLGFDTISSVTPAPAALQLGTLQEVWDARTASWTLAVDTVGDQAPWTEAGAGPVGPTASTTWDPAASDSVTFTLDSAYLAEWADAADQSRGGRLLSTTDSVFLVLNRARFRVSMRSSLADTIVEDTVDILERTVVYDPPAAAPTGIRVGGAPAWRTLMAVSVPELTGPPELCAAVGCPFTPEAGQISYAALALTSEASEAAFQPYDTLRLDVRSVLSPATLPKSPLGVSETGGVGQAIVPEAFGSAAGVSVDVPVTAFLRTLLAGPDAAGNVPSSVLALLAAPEPSALGYASFVGPGGSGEPMLKMILTVGNPQELP